MAFTSLNALSSFIVVARRRSFAAAARDLSVSTSALSQSVRQLEERLGVTLLTRTSRSVALTDAGERLLANAGPAVDQALASLKTVSASAGEISGRVKLSVPAGATTTILSRILPAFAERYPSVELDVRIDDRFIDIVEEGFDAGIRLVEAIDRDMVHIRLTPPCRLVVVGAPAYFKRRGVPQKPEDLLHHSCIAVRWAATDEPAPWEFERGKRKWRVPVRGPITTGDITLRRSIALAGTGLIWTIEPLLSDLIASGKLKVVLEGYAPVVPGLFLYFPSRSQVSPALRAFVDLAREMAVQSKKSSHSPRKRS